MKHALSLLAVLTFAGSAYAAAPVGDDQARIQDALKAQGYAKWKRIEFDKGVYEVDDAIDAAGKQFDLRIEASSLKVIEKEAED